MAATQIYLWSQLLVQIKLCSWDLLSWLLWFLRFLYFLALPIILKCRRKKGHHRIPWWKLTYIDILVLLFLTAGIWEFGIIEFMKNHVFMTGLRLLLIFLWSSRHRFFSHDDEFDVLFLSVFEDIKGIDENEAWCGWCHIEFVIVFTSF